MWVLLLLKKTNKEKREKTSVFNTRKQIKKYKVTLFRDLEVTALKLQRNYLADKIKTI